MLAVKQYEIGYDDIVGKLTSQWPLGQNKETNAIRLSITYTSLCVVYVPYNIAS